VRVSGSRWETTSWTSASSVVCKAASGAASGRLVVLSAGVSASGSLSGSVSYNVAAGLMLPSNAAATGGSRVTLLGANLASVDWTGRSRVRGSALEATPWAADSSVVGKYPGGLGVCLRVASTVVSQWTLTLAVSFGKWNPFLS
jgi:hypothetical protein